MPYVAQSASGSGDGSSFANRMSVSSHNSSNFNAGDTIFLCGGDITSQITIPSSGSSGSPITYTEYESSPATIKTVNAGGAIRADEINHIHIDDLELRNGDRGIGMRDCGHIRITRTLIDTMTDRGMLIANSNNLTIGGEAGMGNIVRYTGSNTSGGDVALGSCTDAVISYNQLLGDPNGLGADGIVMEWTEKVLIEYNLLSDHKGSPGEDGVDLKGSSNIIMRYNIAANNRQEGLKVNRVDWGPYDRSCHNIVIYHNLSHNNRANSSVSGHQEHEQHSNIYIWGNIFHTATSQHNSIIGTQGNNVHYYNNTVYHVVDSAKANLYTLRGSDFFIKNNIFVRLNSRRQIWNYADENGVYIDNNLYWYASQSSQIYWNGSWRNASNVDASLVEADPLLADPGNGDFSLQEGSPAIGSGSFISVSPPNITVQGKTYAFNMNEVLLASTDWSVFPPVIETTVPLATDIGAYAFEAGSPPDPDPDPDPSTGGFFGLIIGTNI